jgi:hypothetical protein
MSKYLTALKRQDFSRVNTRAPQELQEGPSYSYCSPQVARPQKCQGATASNLATRQATQDERLELAALLGVILPGDAEGQAEALKIALADVDAALMSLRALAADLPPAPPDPLPALPTCESCRNLTTLRDRDGYRRCLAAPRRYNPAPDLGRRCENYLPAPDEPDQRMGRERCRGWIKPPFQVLPPTRPVAAFGDIAERIQRWLRNERRFLKPGSQARVAIRVASRRGAVTRRPWQCWR